MNYKVFNEKDTLLCETAIPYLVNPGDILSINKVGLLKVLNISYPIYKDGKCETTTIGITCHLISPPSEWGLTTDTGVFN